ncbi:MAG: flagellar biosynthetic protein FliR [Elusimicrobiales bacterium]|nr:flagellar biosynthetic protein FliR [Elusimicrobiales bacterium]
MPDVNYITLLLIPLPRIFGFLFFSPIPFPYQNYKLKTIFAISLSLILSNYIAKYEFKLTIILCEILLGMILGFVVKLSVYVFSLLGIILDFQSGMMMNRVADPLNPEHTTVFSSFFNTVAILIFLCIDGHLYLIKVFAKSFEIIQPQKISFENIIYIPIESFIYFFMLGIKFSIPIIFCSLISEIVIGILSKIMPTLNFMIIGQPSRFIIAMICVFMFISFFYKISENVFFDLSNQINYIFSKI